MTDILLYAASLPALVVHFVAGATAGGIGGLIGYFAGKQFGYEEIWRFTPIVFVVISFNLVTMWLERASGPVKAVNELKQSASSISFSSIIPKPKGKLSPGLNRSIPDRASKSVPCRAYWVPTSPTAMSICTRRRRRTPSFITYCRRKRT
jgi:hypothetical protein